MSNNAIDARSIHLEQLKNQAKAIKSRRIKNNTHGLYASKMKIMFEWLNSFPQLKEECIDQNGLLILPLPVSVVEAFFAEVVVKEVTEDIREMLSNEGNKNEIYIIMLLFCDKMLLYCDHMLHCCHRMLICCPCMLL